MRGRSATGEGKVRATARRLEGDGGVHGCPLQTRSEGARLRSKCGGATPIRSGGGRLQSRLARVQIEVQLKLDQSSLTN
jgi:hypothetical protein